MHALNHQSFELFTDSEALLWNHMLLITVLRDYPIAIRLYNKTDSTTSVLLQKHMVDKHWLDLISHADFSFNVYRENIKSHLNIYVLWFVYAIEYMSTTS